MTEKNRGFFDFGTSEPIESTIVGEFKGFARAASTRLPTARSGNRSKRPRWPAYAGPTPRSPSSPGMFNNWFMRIDGYNTAAKVRRIK